MDRIDWYWRPRLLGITDDFCSLSTCRQPNPRTKCTGCPAGHWHRYCGSACARLDWQRHRRLCPRVDKNPIPDGQVLTNFAHRDPPLY